MATYILTIEGVTRTLQPDWNISAPANGPGTMTFEVYSADGSYIPDLGDEVILTEDGTRIFGGIIKTKHVKGAGGHPITPITTELTATDFNTLATRRFFSGTLTGTMEDFLNVLVNYIDGATLDPAQVTGPAMTAATFTAWKVSDILDQMATMTGYVWEVDYSKVLSMYTPGTRNAPFVITATNGLTIGDITAESTREQYANRVYVYGTGVTGIAEDAAEVTSNGAYESVVQSLDITEQAAADALADAILATSLPTLKRVKYRTAQTGVLPGQTQNITLAARSINNTYLITEVNVQAVLEKHVHRYVTAVEGLIYRSGWRETVRSWGGIGASQTAGLMGGGGSGVQYLRNAYFLGGTGADFVRSATPTWVAASPIQASVNTVTRGTTNAVVYARLRALDAGVSVQARLFDVTDDSPCSGTSAVVTSTDWTLVSFNVTLTPGAHYYQLQLLPGTANKEVGAVGYIE